MLRLSIVIPVLGDSRQLDDTLLSVLENRPNDCEIVVVHNAPYADPYSLGDEVRFIAAPGADAIECLNRGFEASRATIVHVLACGVEVLPEWSEAALRRFDDPSVAAVGAMIVDRQNHQRVVSVGWGYRFEGIAWRLGPTEADASNYCPDLLAAFYDKAAVQSAGGFWPAVGERLAAVDMAMALRRAGFRCVEEPQCTVRVDVAALGTESGFQWGRRGERLFWRWASSRGRWVSTASHAALWVGQCAACLRRPATVLQLAGRAVGVLEALLGRRRRRSWVDAPAPSVIGQPHFSLAARRAKQREQSRVA